MSKEAFGLAGSSHAPVEAPRFASEKVISLGNRDIIVIGTNHGLSPTEGFPGKSQVETELATFEAAYGPLTGLAIDSQRNLTNPQQGTSPMSEWAETYAITKTVPLVHTDPVNTRIVNILTTLEVFKDRNIPQAEEAYAEVMAEHPELTTKGLARSFPSKREQVAEAFRRYQVTDALQGELALLAAFGAAMVPFAMRQTTRRAALGLGAFAVFEVGVNSVRNKAMSDVNSQSFLYKELTDDVVALNKRLDEHHGTLTEEDYASPEFQRVMYYNAKVKAVTHGFRNACMAEVLTSAKPLRKSEAQERERVALVVGGSHLMVEEKYRISYLLTHPEERRKLINDYLAILENPDIQATLAKYNTDVKQSLNELNTYPALYTLDKSGKVQAEKLPTLKELIAS